MALPNNPITRKEMYLSNMAGQGTALPSEPITREEEYLDYIAKNGGGPGDGDMKKSVYDSDAAVSTAGGIKAFVNAATSALQPKTLDTPITIGGVLRTTVEAALGALEDSKEDTILAATPLVKEYDEVMRQDVLRLTMDDTPTASSNNPVKSGGVKSAVTATVDLLKDTTGWTGKNKNYHNAQTSTAGTVTYTVNANKTVELSGTTTSSTIKDLRTYTGAELKALGSILVLSGGNAKAYLAIRTLNYTFIARSFGNAVEFDTSALEDATTYYETIGVSVPSGSSVDLTGVVIYPMITTPEEYKLSPSYEPYHESVELSKYNRSEANILGAKNLFPIDLNTLKAKNTTGTWSDNVYSLNNATITCTVENGYVTEITANSENPISQNTNFILFDGSNSTNLVNSLKGKELTLNGCPKNGSNTSYRMLFSTWGTVENKYDDGNGCTVDVPNNVSGMRFDVILYSGYTPNNLKFRPMIRLATDTDSDFAPYAMTNRELTDAVTPKKLEETSTSEQVARITVPTSFRIAYVFVSIDSDKTFQCVIAKGITSRAFRFTYKASSNTEVRGYIWYDYTNSRIEVGSFMVNDVEMKNDTNIKLEVFYI